MRRGADEHDSSDGKVDPTMMKLRLTSVCLLMLVLGACSSDEPSRARPGFDVTPPGAEAPPLVSPTIPDPTVPLDPTKDNDLDGYLFADDCDDRDANVNPGAFDVAGDGIDNDCNGTPDDGDTCDDAPYQRSELATTDAMDFARAMNLCRAATAEDPRRAWGVIEAKLLRLDNTPIERPTQHGILGQYGAYVQPIKGERFAALSTYFAREPSDYSDFTDLGSRHTTQIPQGFSKPNPACGAGGSAVDGIKLRLELRVPTNARGFRFAVDYFTASYPTANCGLIDTAFVALLDSIQAVPPERHGNIATDAKGNAISPATAALRVCMPYDGSSFPFGMAFDCPLGPRDLVGTGYENPPSSFKMRSNTSPGFTIGGASTSWFDTGAAVSAGEIITLDLALWGPNDLVLLDDWRWLTEPTTPVIVPR